jgi:hypothetical protein
MGKREGKKRSEKDRREGGVKGKGGGKMRG